MPRKKREATVQRERLLAAFNQLEPVGRRFAVNYVEKVLELQRLEAVVQKVREYQETGQECCAFCGKTQDEVGHMLASQTGACICSDCGTLCASLLDEAEET